MSEFQRVADVRDIPVDCGIRVDIDGVPVAIFNAGGQFYACQDTCTHDYASLSEGEVFDAMVECPLHGARFDLETGKVKSLPAVVPVKVYDVSVQGDDILVRMPSS